MTDQHLTPTLEPVLDEPVSDVVDATTVVAEAIAVIDGALAQMMQRELVASGEVADLLLDLRTLLSSTA